MKSKKTIEALNNPVVIEKVEYLKVSWDDLTDLELSNRIKDLVALDCPVTAIADRLGKGESTVRYRKNKVAAKEASAVEEPYYGNKLQKIMEMPSAPKPEAPAPPVLRRSDQVKECAIDFLRALHLAPPFVLQTLELTQVLCDTMEYSGDAPSPLPPEVTPKAIFAEFKPRGLEDPGAPAEFLAVSLFRLMPESYDRDSLLKELVAEFRTQSLRR
jgi:hypothetical protein